MVSDEGGRPPAENERGSAEVYHSTDQGMRVRAFGLNIGNPDEKRSSAPAKEGQMRSRRKYFALVPAIAGSVFLGALFIGWVFMLVIGAIWHEFGFLSPIGFWPALGISLGLLVIASMLRSGVNVVETKRD